VVVGSASVLSQVGLGLGMPAVYVLLVCSAVLTRPLQEHQLQHTSKALQVGIVSPLHAVGACMPWPVARELASKLLGLSGLHLRGCCLQTASGVLRELVGITRSGQQSGAAYMPSNSLLQLLS
jgi:hypothetical protein